PSGVSTTTTETETTAMATTTTSSAEAGPTYRFGPLERRGLVAGLRKGQVGGVVGAALVAIAALVGISRAGRWTVGGVQAAAGPDGRAVGADLGHLLGPQPQRGAGVAQRRPHPRPPVAGGRPGEAASPPDPQDRAHARNRWPAWGADGGGARGGLLHRRRSGPPPGVRSVRPGRTGPPPGRVGWGAGRPGPGRLPGQSAAVGGAHRPGRRRGAGPGRPLGSGRAREPPAGRHLLGPGRSGRAGHPGP